MHEPTLRHILIDFENVPHTSLAAVAGMDVEITLLLGEKNKRLDVALVEQLLAAGLRAQVVRVGASGRNALDLTLAYYLGRAAVLSSRTHFYIVSKDSDYDAMIRHVKATGLQVERCDSIESLSFLRKPATPVPPPARTRAEPPPTPARTRTEPPPTPAPDSRVEEIARHLREHPRNRPVRRTTLLRFINSSHAGMLTERELAELAAQLEHAGYLSISPKGAVTYRI